MAIINNEIISVDSLLSKELSIPNYQRPYRWSKQSINHLFNDILDASKQNLSEYRIGTIVIHKHNNSKQDIVDGQQRTISLYLINDILEEKTLEKELVGKSAVSINYKEVKRLYNALPIEIKRTFKKYFNDSVKVIFIEIDNEMQAFQFFDSQNARGKSLESHDLLKAYHLREMRSDSAEVKLRLIESWEEQKSNVLAILFSKYLYRIKQWLNGKDALEFYREGVEMFKGVPMDQQYNYILYHKAAHLFIEKFNRENHQELLGIEALIPFQIEQPILSGRRFFESTIYYLELKIKIDKIVYEQLPVSVDPHKTSEGTGTRYIRELYEALLLYFYDRFGLNNRNRQIEKLFLIYCYQLRCINYAVFEKSINKYVLGRNGRLNPDYNLFEEIKNASSPKDIEMIELDEIHFEQVTSKYQKEEFTDLRKEIGVIEND